jgi:transcriptional regulator with XRE-family HTH domain
MKTPGGSRLRALREYLGKTQLEVEIDAELGLGYLQRIESGKVRHPERDTLERILTALGAQYTERRDILELFGYAVDTPLPLQPEIEWAIASCQSELATAVFPAYLLDCAHRVLAWNAFFIKLFGPIGLSHPYCLSVLKMLFDPRYSVTPLIANPDVFFPAQIRALRYEMRWFRSETWYEALIDEMLAECPLFRHYWLDSLAQQQSYLVAARPLVSFELNVPHAGLLRFRLTSEPFAQDRRFRVIYYIPADALTITQCVAWQ